MVVVSNLPPPPAMSATDETCREESMRTFLRGQGLQVTYTHNGTEIVSGTVTGEVVEVRGGTADKDTEKRSPEPGEPAEPVTAHRARSAARTRSGSPVGIPGL